MSLCPVCKNEPLVQVEEADVCAATCPNCHGTWISEMALERRTKMEITPDGPHVAMAPLTELADAASHADSSGPLECAICRQVMSKTRFNPKIPVQIDRCERCGYLWLDAGEQGLLLTLYKEMILGQKETVPGQQERHDRLQTLRQQNPPPNSYRSSNTYVSPISYNSGPDKVDIAVNVGMTVLEIIVDIFLTPSHSYRSSRWW